MKKKFLECTSEVFGKVIATTGGKGTCGARGTIF